MELLQRAVAKDRGFAPAYATLALAYIERFFTFAPEERHLAEQARAAIETAISIDPDLCDAYVARGRLLWSPLSGFSFEKAIRDLRRAAALNPRSVQAHWWLGAVYGHIGLLEQGFQEAQMATELNPIAMPPNHLVEPLLWQGKYEQALEFLRSSPHEGDTSLHGSQIVWALFQLGRIKEARVTVDQYLRDSPEDMGGQLKGLQTLLVAAAGEERKAAEKIKEAIQRQGTG